MDNPVVLPAGYRLAAFESLDSTNAQARRMATDGVPDGTVVWAASQTAGRGRQGRQWQSPKGNLYCSIVIRPEMPAAEAAQLSFVTALALGDAVSDLLPGGAELHYKWPNDLLLGGCKLAGILLESSGAVGGRLDWLVVGAGLNVADHPDVTDGYRATSLRAAGARAGADAGAIAPAVWQEVRTALGLADLPLPPFRIVKEQRATIAQTPAQAARRPAATAPGGAVLLAGDWTATGLPCTIEGAIRSGHRAAEACELSAVGGQSRADTR